VVGLINMWHFVVALTSHHSPLYPLDNPGRRQLGLRRRFIRRFRRRRRTLVTCCLRICISYRNILRKVFFHPESLHRLGRRCAANIVVFVTGPRGSHRRFHLFIRVTQKHRLPDFLLAILNTPIGNGYTIS